MGVSIIIPAYNSEKFLASSIRSVLAQSVGDWELVVVNDGSTDQTGSLAETFSHQDKRIRVVHQENAGISAARNRGISESRADYDYILFLDSDDLLEPDALEILLRVLEQDPKAVAAHGVYRYIDSEGQPLAIAGSYIWPKERLGIDGRRLRARPVNEPTTFEVLAYSNCIPTGAIMIRRAAKAIAGDFDPTLKFGEDWHLWLRLSRLGHIAFVNRVLLSYRRHEGNATSPQALSRMMVFALGIWKKLYTSSDLNAREKRLISLGYRYREFDNAKNHLYVARRRLVRRKFTEASKELRIAMRHILSSMKSPASIFG